MTSSSEGITDPSYRAGSDRTSVRFRSRGQPLDQVAEVARVGDVPDRERPDEDGSVPEELAEERLVYLYGLDLLQVHGLGAAVDRTVQQVELVDRHDEVCALPLPDGAEREEGASGDEDGADDH